MSDDRSLFDPPEDDHSKSARFWAFHRANPQVLQLVIREARILRARSGLDRVSIAMVWEHLRWLYAVKTERAADDFKLNDHHKAFYARMAMREAPDLEGFFELRSAEADADFRESGGPS